MKQLRQAEIKGWSAEDIKAYPFQDPINRDQALAVMDQVNQLRLDVEEIFYNSPAGVLYQQALEHEQGSCIVSSGALAVRSGEKTGRSPMDKRVVEEEGSKNDVWWGKVNIKLSKESFLTNRERAVDYLNTRERLYIVDGFGGWEEEFRVPVRVITSRAYHALFMQNMLVPPTDAELDLFMGTGKDKPFMIYNAGVFPCNRQTEGMTSSTSIAVSFSRKEMVILGTQYAGEMKKGVFTVMNYLMPLMPQRDLPPADRYMPMHASANIGENNDVSIFFGLSGTGKTTLSADPKRDLIGDDEHVWHTKGVFNIEGGCYAKIILLTCDAFGVLPPISKLSPDQVMYHFISGYTAKVAGTEEGVTEPQATFSACFGAPFLVWHPFVYAEMLA